jgi:hypothetical protein
MKHARKMDDGSYMCRYCQIERMLKLNGIIKNGNENTKEDSTPIPIAYLRK